MFGFGKKQVTAEECGGALYEWTWEFLSNDCGRGLGMALYDDFDAKDGMANFLTKKGIPIELQKLHYRLYTHCAIQATCTRLDASKRKGIVQGAMARFNPNPEYDFHNTYSTLEAAYQGKYKFSPAVENLKSSAPPIDWLPYPQAGIINSRYLVDKFVISHLKNHGKLLENFDTYRSPMYASIGTVQRAIEKMFDKVKL